MEYLLLLHSDETAAPAPDTPERAAWMAAWLAYNEFLSSGGHYISSAALAPTGTATTVRLGAGAPTLTDGPYLETKEQLGGYYLVSAADLDEALALAQRIPLPQAAIEVRPIAYRPDVQ